MSKDKKKDIHSLPGPGAEDIVSPDKVQIPIIMSKLTPQRIMNAEKYLKSVGIRPSNLPAMVAWAKSRGYEIATSAQWKTLFDTF